MINYVLLSVEQTLHISIGRALIVKAAAVLFQGIFRCDRTTFGVGVEEEERLEMFFETLADHIFPSGANLQQKTTTRCVCQCIFSYDKTPVSDDSLK